MEKTISMVIFGVITVLAGAIILLFVNNLTDSPHRWCEQEALCNTYNDTYCNENKLVRCSLDSRGCVVAQITNCEHECIDNTCA